MRSARRTTFEEFWMFAPLEEIAARQEETVLGGRELCHRVQSKLTACGFSAPGTGLPLKWLRPRALWQRGRRVGHGVQWEGHGQPHHMRLAPLAMEEVKSAAMDWLHVRAQRGSVHAQVRSSLAPWQTPVHVVVPCTHRTHPMPWLASHLHAQLSSRWEGLDSFAFELAAVHYPAMLDQCLANTSWTPAAVAAWWDFMPRWVSRLDAVVSLNQEWGPSRFDACASEELPDEIQARTLFAMGQALPAQYRDLARLAKVITRSPYLLDVSVQAMLAQASADEVWEAVGASFTWRAENMQQRPVLRLLSQLSHEKQGQVMEGCLEDMWANRTHAHLGENLIMALDACPQWRGWPSALRKCRHFLCLQPQVIARLDRELAALAHVQLEKSLPSCVSSPSLSRL